MSTTMAPETPADRLLLAPDEDFKTAVDQDLRNADSPIGEVLRSDPRIIERWFHMLRSMHRTAEMTLAARQADWDAKEAEFKRQGKRARDAYLQELARFSKQKAGSIRFKTGLELRLMEVRRLALGSTRFLLETALADENIRLLDRTRDLEDAIRLHRGSRPAGDLDPVDQKLWDVLDDEDA